MDPLHEQGVLEDIAGGHDSDDHIVIDAVRLRLHMFEDCDLCINPNPEVSQ